MGGSRESNTISITKGGPCVAIFRRSKLRIVYCYASAINVLGMQAPRNRDYLDA